MVLSNLTKRQKQILDYVAQFIEINGYSPSFMDIAGYFRFSSVSTVHEHIHRLEHKGYIRMVKGEPRSISLGYRTLSARSVIELPLMGFLKPGEPIISPRHPRTIYVTGDIVNTESNSFVLQNKGNSMMVDGILDGDYIIIERRSDPEEGRMILAIADKRAELRKYYKGAKHTCLEPAYCETKHTKSLAIQGVVKAVIRKL